MSEENDDYGNLFQEVDPLLRRLLDEGGDGDVRKMKEQLEDLAKRSRTTQGLLGQWVREFEKDPDALANSYQRRVYYTAKATELLSQHWTPDLEVLLWVIEKYYSGSDKKTTPKKAVVVHEILGRFKEDEYGMTESKAESIDAIARPMQDRQGGRRKTN